LHGIAFLPFALSSISQILCATFPLLVNTNLRTIIPKIRAPFLSSINAHLAVFIALAVFFWCVVAFWEGWAVVFHSYFLSIVWEYKIDPFANPLVALITAVTGWLITLW
jgi:hypothetical protein